MEPTYWQERWREGRIGWNQDAPNAHLTRHTDVLEGAKRVLVPLCGKSVDLAFLASGGASVVGVELVEEAARAFFEEQRIPAHRTQDGPLVRWEGATIEIVVGDFFDITSSEIGRFDACFDRAALVALPAETRVRYAAHLRTLLKPGARMLLVTFEHDAPPNDPPFSVPEREVRALYAGATIERLETLELAAAGSSLHARGARAVVEHVFRIELPA